MEQRFRNPGKNIRRRGTKHTHKGKKGNRKEKRGKIHTFLNHLFAKLSIVDKQHAWIRDVLNEPTTYEKNRRKKKK